MPRNKGFPDALVAQALDDALAVAATVPVLAISGLQGSGKSTLAAQVVALAQQRGLRAAALSIDDFYLTRAQLERFVQYYERVSRQALRTLPALADRVVVLDEQRRIVS